MVYMASPKDRGKNDAEDKIPRELARKSLVDCIILIILVQPHNIINQARYLSLLEVAFITFFTCLY